MPGNQVNVEYVYRLAYDCLRGACYGSFDSSQLSALLAQAWYWITIIGYALSVVVFGLLIYVTVKLYELRHREEEFYSTLIVPPESAGGSHPRWQHIQSLIESASPSDWRTAIIEADVMLDDILSLQGYVGVGIGEKLKSAHTKNFATLQDAWEAHKVRNQIAHQGSTFDLSESLAKRTLAHYEAVFREFGVI